MTPTYPFLTKRIEMASERLDELRRRYPWPAERPTGNGECTGWFAGANRTALKGVMQQGGMNIILELGSWQGLSAKWFATEMPPGSVLICIDHWEGSSEHHRRPDWEAKLATLYDTFLCNLWPYRDRVIPMRTTTLDGMAELRRLGILPNLIYVDAAHEEEHVFNDTCCAMELFPEAEILGDDWPHDSVRRGVVRASSRSSLLAVHGCSCWQLHIDKRRILEAKWKGPKGELKK